MEEIWKKYPRNENYLISNLGKVKGKTGKILSSRPRSEKDSHLVVDIRNGTSKNTKYIHRLVMETFNPIENMDSMIVDHINGIQTDNNLNNLRWVTLEENNSLRKQNRERINQKINELIQKYGYEKTEQIILSLN